MNTSEDLTIHNFYAGHFQRFGWTHGNANTDAPTLSRNELQTNFIVRTAIDPNFKITTN